MKSNVIYVDFARSVKPRYAHIKAYGQYSGQPHFVTNAITKQAIRDGAPWNAVYKDEGKWFDHEDLLYITDKEVHTYIADLVALMGINPFIPRRI